MTATEPMAQRPPRRWDPVVKLTHWTIALAVLGNAVVTEAGSPTHVWVGYGLAAILALRLLWGVIGPAEARFSAFVPSVRRAAAHVRDIRAGRHSEHVSHNPLGTLMVYAIWSCLLVLIGTGIAMAGLPPTQLSPPATPAAQAVQPAAEAGEDERDAQHDDAGETGEAGEGAEEGPLGEVHEVAANLLYLLILLHIAGVVFETRRSGPRLLLAMLPGRR